MLSSNGQTSFMKLSVKEKKKEWKYAMKNKFEQALRAEYPVNYTYMKTEIIEQNVTLKEI